MAWIIDSASVGGQKRDYQLDKLLLPHAPRAAIELVEFYLMRKTYLPRLSDRELVRIAVQHAYGLPRDDLAMTLLALCGALLRTDLLQLWRFVRPAGGLLQMALNARPRRRPTLIRSATDALRPAERSYAC